MKKKIVLGLFILFASILVLGSCSKSKSFIKAMEEGNIDKIEKILSSTDDSFLDEISKSQGLPGGDFSYKLNESGDGVIITGYNGKSKTVVIPSEIEDYPVVEIGEQAFIGREFFGGSELNKINSVIIPSSVKVIGAYAFCFNHLKSIVVPDSVQSIGNSAFSSCKKLEYAKIGNSVKFLEFNTFDDCKKLRKVVLGNSVEGLISIMRENGSIYSIFSGCESLSEINFPASLQVITPYTFSNCKELCKIEFANELKKIVFYTIEEKDYSSPNWKYIKVNNAFAGCQKLPLKTRKKLQELGYKDEF